MSSVTIHLALLLLAAAIIYVACEFFVNGVEWVGHRFDLSQKATGTILAAFGTALPESVITFIAVTFGKNETAQQIGVGAALGGPLVLATIAYAIVGATLFMKRQAIQRSGPGRVDFHGLSRDQGWFLAIFAAKIALGTVVFAWKPWLGLLFLAAYALYVWTETRAGNDDDDDLLEPLRIAPGRAEPSMLLALGQTLAALIVIFIASDFFIGQLASLTPSLGLSPQLASLLISPIATELPETLNAVIWVRQGKQRLALANISGAMMIQATVPTAFGLFFTPWLLDRALLWSALVTAIAIMGLYTLFRTGRMNSRSLAGFGLFYLVFAAGIVAMLRW